MDLQNKKTPLFKCLAKPLLIGMLVGVAACFCVLLILATIATMQTLPHAYVVPLGVAATGVGAFFGGWSGARISARNGWLIGLLVALLLYILLLLVGIGHYLEWRGVYMLVKFAVMLSCGMLGGMIAVNTRKRSVHRYR